MAKIGVVVPVYQGEPTLDELHRRVVAALTALTDDWQLVLVDDGSQDRSWAMIEGYVAADPRVRAIKFIRNYGEHVAITAGLDHVDADYAVIMACDLQDDPAALPAIIEAATTTGSDLVLTRRMPRQDPLVKRTMARLFYAMVLLFTHVHYDHRVGNYRCLSRRAVTYFREHREHTRNVNAIMAIMHVKTTTIDVRHQPRAGGTSGYSLYRSAQMAFHVLVGYSDVPLKMVVVLGVAIIAVAIGRLISLAAFAAPADAAVHAIDQATAVLALIGGLVILAIGTVGVYLTKSFVETMRRPLYFVETFRGVR